MRLALIALILFLGLTLANVTLYKRDMRNIQNPYHAKPVTAIGALASAATGDRPENRARTAFVWREIGALVLTGALWGFIAASRRER
ncbi:MAG TPA: hypothetical protein VIG51_10490 [Candidatus Baltobacteraceae bacterium]|jgi:hypothetical protein